MGILAKNTDAATDADVIVTAAVLGFVATRILQGQPVSFDIGHPTEEAWNKYTKEILIEWQNFLDAMSAMSEVLIFCGFPKKTLADGQSPPWKKGATITGMPGGHMMKSSERTKEMKTLESKRVLIEESERSRTDTRGGYIGMIDDPITGKTLAKGTEEIVISSKGRWSLEEKESIIGRVHGMSWAMLECIKTGPWCTPYELAIGGETTKMASCFPCSTYMYAAGFPPSSTHLGRGSFWHPLPERGSEVEVRIARAINVRWHADVYYYLQLGVDCMVKCCNFRGKPTIAKSHLKSLFFLSKALEKRSLIEGGNLFLDALTISEQDWARINRTLTPSFGSGLLQQSKL